MMGHTYHPPPPDHQRRQAARRLGAFVEAEARRTLSEAQLAPDPNRVASGWVRRFIADAVRAREAIALYESLGYEVCADPLRAEEMADDCQDCVLLAQLGFVTIYTRRSQNDEGSETEATGPEDQP